jgi:DNA-binding transcriptional MerR regulator
MDGLKHRPVLNPINVAARLTGIGIDTLRAWERRHHAIRPTRDERGRMYSDADIERLRLLRDAVANGHPIGRIAHLDDQALRGLATAPHPADRGERRVEPTAAEAVVDALMRFDVATLETLLSQAAALMRPAVLLGEVVLPALRTVGDEWHAGRLGVEHEHLLTSHVRDALGSLMRVHARGDVPDRLIFATPAGERHEFGALGAALMTASGGLGAIYVGADLPAKALIDMASVVGPDVIALGVTGSEQSAANLVREVERIAEAVSPDIELWLGGPAATEVAAAVRPRALAIADYEALGRELQRLGARL